jgi:hypothetical protein
MARASIKIDPVIVLELTEEEAKYLQDALTSRSGLTANAIYAALEVGIRDIKHPDYPYSK